MPTIELVLMVRYSVAPMGVQPVLDEQRVTRHAKAEHEIDHAGEGKAGEQSGRRRPDRIGERGPQLPEQIEQRDDRDQRGILEQRDEGVDEAGYDVAQRLPHAMGGLVQTEVEVLRRLTESVERPYAVVLGGAKVSDKLGVIANLLKTADRLLIGGGMANTFFMAQGRQMGGSLVEPTALDTARDLLAKSSAKLILPVDATIADAFKNDANTRVLKADEPVPDGWQILDIGPATIEAFRAQLADAKTVIWNGPMGVFEMENFAKGTRAVAEILADLTAKGTITIIGGGDSAAAVQQAGLADKMTHISTGGGASLELLEGQTLPGVAALQDK